MADKQRKLSGKNRFLHAIDVLLDSTMDPDCLFYGLFYQTKMLEMCVFTWQTLFVICDAII